MQIFKKFTRELRKENKPWMTENLIKKTKYKSYLYGKYMATKCPEIEREYLIAKKETVRRYGQSVCK